MFKIKNRNAEIQHPYGDFLYGEGIQEYIRMFKKKDIEGKNVLNLGYFDYNRWTAIQKMGVFDQKQLELLHSMGKYDCEYTNRDYDGFLPLCIFSDDIEKYITNKEVWWFDMGTDRTWNLSGESPYEEYADVVIDGINHVMMGSGYASGFITNDGSYSHVPVLMDIEDTNDVIYGVALCWHNK